LICELEQIIGYQTYNGFSENHGARGIYLYSGQSFRYPLTYFIEDKKQKTKFKMSSELKNEEVMKSYYAFGANQLHIMMGLMKILNYLEKNYDLKIEDFEEVVEEK
jgi:hypothetical protein